MHACDACVSKGRSTYKACFRHVIYAIVVYTTYVSALFQSGFHVFFFDALLDFTPGGAASVY